MDDIETIKTIRELETVVRNDFKKSNGIITIKKYMKNNHSEKVRMAAFHSLRRIFAQILENDNILCGEKSAAADTYRVWILKQMKDYAGILYEWIKSGNETFQVAGSKSLIELVRRGDILNLNSNTNSDGPRFGTFIYISVITSLLMAQELSADLLLILREEVFSKADCAFYTFQTVSDFLKEYKLILSSADCTQQDRDNQETITRNAIDLLRVCPLFEEIDANEDLLCSHHTVGEDPEGDQDEDSSEEHPDSDEDQDGHPNAKSGLSGSKRKIGQSGSQKNPSNKNKSGGSSSKRRKPIVEQILSPASHRRLFNRAWLSLLSMALSPGQHKLILRHLPEHVIPHLSRPLLLADYLTSSYNCGGAIAVLALESLFQLILTHNLDYPHFFESLYRLCSVDTFNSKYRVKFMELLHKSLKSSNLPAYIVASFCKRLIRLALHVSSPSALFCIAQVIWLLKRHPPCLVLLHRQPATTLADGSEGSYSQLSGDPFDPEEENDLEKTRALDSSLWELEALKQHHLHAVSLLATSLEREESTTMTRDSLVLAVEEFMSSNYADMIDEQLKDVKKFSSLAFKEPIRLLNSQEITGSCFGF